MGYRSAVLIYVILFALLTFPYWLQQDIVAPYRPAAELGTSTVSKAVLEENTKFGDYFKGFIPELSAQIEGGQIHGVAAWTDKNELGRPLLHVFGLSAAYLPTRIIAGLIQDPLRVFTVLSIGTCFLAGLFVLLFCREESISPIAALVAAGSFAGSPAFMYWLTFPMFAGTSCWSAGVLFALTRLARKADLAGWSVLSFCTYSVLMTGYLQNVVFYVYLAAGYVAYLALKRRREVGSKDSVLFLLLSATGALAGGLAVLPVFIDLFHAAADSARLTADASFFTVYLPIVDTLLPVLRGLLVGTLPMLFGNPSSPGYPLPYDEQSVVTPLVICLALICLLLRWRETWGWWLAIFVLCGMAFVHPVYTFAVQHLGFNLSRDTPLDHLTLPLVIISAYGADTLTRTRRSRREANGLTIAVVIAVVLLVIEMGVGWYLGVPLVWSAVATTVAIIALVSSQLRGPRPYLLVLALVFVGAGISFPLMLRQDRATIPSTSPLVEAVRAHLPSGSRFAVVAPGIAALPPNFNATVGLASVHSYNGLSTRRYHALIAALGGETTSYGRWNSFIAPDYTSDIFWMSNISILLSPLSLDNSALSEAGVIDGVHLYRVNERMGEALQVPLPEGVSGIDVAIGDPRRQAFHRPVKTLDRIDLRIFDLEENERPSLLILSQMFHGDWFARVLTMSGWIGAKTVSVNGVFQGVMLPAGARQVRLEFLSAVRFAWISQLFFVLLLALNAGLAVRHRVSGRTTERNSS